MKIPLFKIYNNVLDKKAVNDVLDRRSHWALGPEIETFEFALANFVNRKYAVLFNSGTSALHAMLLAYDIDSLDDILIPSFTFQATANAVRFVDADPVFCDIEPETFGLNTNSVAQKCCKWTKAIMPIHYGGCPARDTEQLVTFAKNNELLFFEDAAQSLGASIGNKKVGSFGDASIFSFCQDKVVAIGEGGVVLVDDDDIYAKLLKIRSHGRTNDKNYFTSTESYDYDSLGYNWRMTTMNAALGLAQFRQLPHIVTLKREVADYYNQNLKGLVKKGYVVLPTLQPSNFYHVYQKYTIRVLNGKRDRLQQYLKEKGIQTRAYFGLPVHKTTYYKKLMEDEKETHRLPETNKASKEVLSLPVYPNMSKTETGYVINRIKEFFK